MRRKRKYLRFVALLLILALLIAATVEIDSRLRVLINNYAQSEAKILSNRIINESIHNYLVENNIRYNDLSIINTAADGSVTSVEFDTVALTELKSGIIKIIQNNISAVKNILMNVHLGTLSGSQFLVNRGPTIRLELQISSAVYSKMTSKFISAGINQTLHQITMNVISEVYFVMPWYRSSGNFQTEFILAETVIVGKVPDAYTNVIEYPGSNIAGEIFDYSAEMG